MKYLFNRFLYSMVWCNKCNCVGVRDDLLVKPDRSPAERFYIGHSYGHICDSKKRPMALISPEGKWEGKTDKGQGSPVIR